MNVEIPKNCSEEENQQIQNILEESIANILGKDPKNVNVIIDPETSEASYEISVVDPTLAEEIQKAMSTDNFKQNVTKIIDKNKKNLSQRIQDVLEINDVKPGDIVDATNDTDFDKTKVMSCLYDSWTDDMKCKQTCKVVIGTMNVEMSENISEEELEQIENALEESIANSLGKDPKDVKVTIDPETGETTYAISVDDPSLAEEIQKTIKFDDFSENVNKDIAKNKQNLPQRIQNVLEIKDVKPKVIADQNDDVNKAKQTSKTVVDKYTASEEIKCKWQQFEIYFNFYSSVDLEKK